MATLMLEQVSGMPLEELSDGDWIDALAACVEIAKCGDVELARVKWLARRIDGKTHTDSE